MRRQCTLQVRVLVVYVWPESVEEMKCCYNKLLPVI